MSRIPESELERIKSEIDLVALVQSKGIELKKHGGKDLIARCPFHEEKTSSFIITPSKNLFHCMGCGVGGSVIDFVMKYEGISFRHAYEVLAGGSAKVLMKASTPLKCSTVPKLESPLAFDADDETLTRQAIDYYHERLKATPSALSYLEQRGITPEAMDHFKIGFADRTLGLRLPTAQRKGGNEIRERLKKIGLLREETGHEHFNGCVTFPILNGEGKITEIYGRRTERKQSTGIYHLYLPGPHIGIFNSEAFKGSREIILCESVIDALSFWCNGFKNVTTIYGTQGFTEELQKAFIDYKTQKVYIAYDRDEAGERATERDAKWFLEKGIECFRVQFPYGMDANSFAVAASSQSRNCGKYAVEKSLGLLVNSALWLGGSKIKEPVTPLETPTHTPAPSSSLAALLAAKEKKAQEISNPLSPIDSPTTVGVKEKKAEPEKENSFLAASVPVVEQVGEDLFIKLGERDYRVRGLEKNQGMEAMRINLRLMVNGLYHVNILDLYRARERQSFTEEASKETLLDVELIKRDLGKLLLALEELQEKRFSASVASAASVVPEMTEREREEALELLRDKNLLSRIVSDFSITGEERNKLVGYLGTVSRLLEKPLAVIIQSTSASGKSSLMEGILAMMPKESVIKYSAMTGQSLFYLGEKDLKNKILAIVEEEGAEKASYALKLLQSEGELTIASTGKDEQGRLKTEEYHVEGPVMIFLTTTAVEIDEELLNRCIVLTVDESQEQTQAIHQLQREAETLEGLQRRIEKEKVRHLHRNAQRLLRPLAVVNAFAPKLTFLSSKTRMRRDHMKYLTLIRTVTLLHQYQREIKTLANGTDYIEVAFCDIEAANGLAHEILGRSLDELSPQTRKLLGILQGMVRERREKNKIDFDQCLLSRREIREKTGWSQTQLKIHLDRLTDHEYLVARFGRRGQCYVYEVLFDGDIDQSKPQLNGLASFTGIFDGTL